MKLTWPAPNRRFGLLDALGITGAIGLLVARFVPLAALPFWGCALRERYNWPCLGCGLTRAADHVSHFRFAEAWSANPLGTLAAVAFGLCALWAVLHLAFRVPVPEVEVTSREAVALRVLVVMAILVNYAFVVVQTRHPGLF